VNKSAVCRVANAIRATDPTFSGVSIYDVSALKPGFIEVAAVYARTTGSPLALLWFFDWSGALTRKVVLDKLPQIESLEIDDAGHVWALNDLGDRGAKCLFTEFDPDGSVVRKLVKTRRRWSTDESASKGGQVSFGLTAGRVWTWLPSTRTLVSVNESKGKSMIRRTGLPSVGNNARIYLGKAELQADGRLVMEVLGDGDKGHFVWSAATGWKRD